VTPTDVNDRHEEKRTTMAVTVKLPTILRKFSGNEAKVGADGDTLRDVLTDLEGHYPGITKNVISDDGGLTTGQ
jgi:hypothetical protein